MMHRSGLVSPVLIALPGLIALVLLAMTTAPTAVHGFELNCVADRTGDWDVASTWTSCNGSTPGEGDGAFINAEAPYVVTIPAGLTVNVLTITVGSYGRLINKGDLSALWIVVTNGALHSTGSLQLVDTVGAANTFLHSSYGTVEISGDLNIIGQDAAFLELSYSEATFGGSINITAGQYGEAYVVVHSKSRATVAGDVTVLGGCEEYFKKRENNDRSEDSVEGGKKDRGFNFAESGLGLEEDSFLQVRGNVKLTTRDFNDNSTTGSTRDVSLSFDGGDLVIGGDLLVQSGDGLLAETGDASITTGDSLEDLIVYGYQPSDFNAGSLVVGGSVTVKSGSAMGLRNESGQAGYQAGGAWINLVKGFLLANGSQSTVTVQSGNPGPSVYSGRKAENARVLMGLGSQLAVTKHLIVQASRGGDAGLGETAGQGGDSLLDVAFGGDVLVGGNLQMLGGNGGNSSMNTTAAASQAGNGGQAGVRMINGGSINVAGDLLVTPGSAGQAAVGSSAYAGGIYLGTASYGGPCNKRGDCKRGFSFYVGSGDMNVRVGGDLKVGAGSPSSSTYEGFDGGSCQGGTNYQNTGGSTTMGGLVVENVWEGEIIIGGDLIVTGCNGGSSVGGSGGSSSVVSAVSVSGGVTLDVYGSVVLEGGNGGSTLGGSSNGGGAGSAKLEVYEHSLANVGGSVTLTGGAGGDVVNGTGSGGGIYRDTELDVYARAHLVVGNGKGAITVIGARGGNVYAENTVDAMGDGGSPSDVYLYLSESSSVTAGDVRLVGSSMGNATVNASSLPVAKRNGAELEAAAPSVSESQAATREDAEETPSRNAGMKRGGGFASNPQMQVKARSWAIINGDLQLLPGTSFFHNMNTPSHSPLSSIIAEDLATITTKGDVTVRGAAGCRVPSSSFNTLEGGRAEIALSGGAVLNARGDIMLRAGDAGRSYANESISGYQGLIAFKLDGARFHQSGMVRLADGQGLKHHFLFSTGVEVDQGSEWTVYPCAGAGLELSDKRNGTDFQVRQLSTFRDCRGSGAKQHYPEPRTDASGDGSCSPCTCTEAPFNACPDGDDDAAAGSVHDNNSALACLRALAALLQL